MARHEESATPAAPRTTTATIRRVTAALDKHTEDERRKIVRALADLYLPATEASGT